MIKQLRWMVVLALLGLTVLPARAASPVYVFHSIDRVALALWAGASDGIVTQVSVTAQNSLAQNPPANPSGNPFAVTLVRIVQYAENCPIWVEGCAPLVSIDGFAQADGVTIDQSLAAGRLNTTLTVHDAVSGQDYPVAVDLAWTGVGKVLRNTGRAHVIREGGFQLVSTGYDFRRQAEVGGNVVNLATNTNYVESLAVYGELERAAGHTITLEIGG